mmetsp:Transcript_34244/g.59947  ORF Transcript_34244/g.59947 Transcript_34244/m.59947 type:complete len:353 (-) Transcript_34244:3155-4213(-)
MSFYITIFSICIFCNLAGYSTAFASSMIRVLPLSGTSCNIYEDNDYFSVCRLQYTFYLLVFGILMLYLCLTGLEHQKWLQVILAFFRFFVVGFMTLICFGLAIKGKSLDGSKNNEDFPEMANFVMFGRAYPVLLLASAYQLTQPSIVQLVKDKEKSLIKIVVCASITCNALYFLVSLSSNLVNASPARLATLDWYELYDTSQHRPPWAYIFSYLVMVFPAIDVASAFPIMSICLADNILSAVHSNSTDKVPVKQIELVLVRILLVVLPVCFAYAVYDLGEFAEWSGLAQLFLVGVFIPLLAIAAKRVVPSRGPYDIISRHDWLLYALMVFNFVCFLISVVLYIVIASRSKEQ